MLEDLEHNRRARNGKDGPHTSVRTPMGLGNTNPVATLGSTLGSGAPVTYEEWVSPPREEFHGQTFVVQAVEGSDIYVRSAEGLLVLETKIAGQGRSLKPAGQIVLFQKVMESWGFDDRESATLLGFERGSDIREIYLGLRPVGHRDANDRLRAVLRIAADLDALYYDKDAVRDWLNEPQRDLGGKTPRALFNDGSMENLLQVKYYVSHLSGR